MSHSEAASAQNYQAVLDNVGLIERTDRTRLSISGPDRAKFLHNLTTNDVKKLAVAHGREAFVTSPQGKTLGFVSIHALEDRLIVRSDRQAQALVLPHFQKYGLFDEIQIDDLTDRTFELHIVGPRADLLIESTFGLPIPATEYDICTVEPTSTPMVVIRERPTGRTGFTVIGPLDARQRVLERMDAAGRDFGLEQLEPATFEILRIEAGTPVFGVDLTEKNLPQELGRDDRAISFVKGCYLGQETVARIDALGHVNQVLRGFRAEPPGERLATGYTVRIDGKVVATLTSAVFSPGWDNWVALGYIREHATTSLDSLAVHGTDGEFVSQVIQSNLPMLPLPRLRPSSNVS